MEDKINVTEGGVTAAQGFQAAGIAAGIKKGGTKDMAMVYSEKPCVCAGTFTTNVVKAAPVKWDQKIVEESDYVQAVVCNSGIANACTGQEGYSYCQETAKAAGEALGISAEEVLVASTGVIGQQLPMAVLKEGVKKLAPMLLGTKEAGTLAAEAIMTTDTVKKEVAVEMELSGKKVTIGGMCKGSGMIHPNMCTMLSFVTTDVDIDKNLLKEALRESVQDSYNMISVDGDTSTNDTVLVLANAMAGNPKITEKNQDYEIFKKGLDYVNKTLAQKIAGDGEGATALFEVKITGAQTKEQAVTLSKSVITSNLTKAAIFGHDANWGRILCAMGYSGAQFDPEKVDLVFESKAGRIQIMKNGIGTDYSEEEATKILSEDKVTVIADIKMGEETATAWGCDLTYDYVKSMRITAHKGESGMVKQKYLDKAEVLIEALPYIQRFNRKIIVVKYGGSAMVDEQLKKTVIQDVVLLKLVGFKPIIVHGGGKEISRWVSKVGKEPQFINGLRVTDGETMELAEMVLNKVNKELVALVESLGVKAVGVSGKDGNLLKVEKKFSNGQDIGFVGNITEVNPKILSDLLEKDFLPIVCPVGLDENFQTYNINADDAACAIAKQMHAEKLAFLTDIEGVYRDPEDPSTLISKLFVKEARELINSGNVGGGMIPKLQNCVDAIEGGVSRVHILDGRIKHCLLLEIFTDKGIGTAILRKDGIQYYDV